jgi:hypothetical protein
MKTEEHKRSGAWVGCGRPNRKKFMPVCLVYSPHDEVFYGENNGGYYT